MSATAASAATVVTANHFTLSGQGIHIDYATTSLNGQPRLSYHDSVRTLSVVGNDIRVDNVPDVGSVVSVTLNITVDDSTVDLAAVVRENHPAFR